MNGPRHRGAEAEAVVIRDVAGLLIAAMAGLGATLFVFVLLMMR